MRVLNLIILSLLSLWLSVVNAQEYEKSDLIKVAFIEKFASFTEWPSATLDNNFYITVIGKTPLKNELIKLSNSRKIKNRIVVVQFIRKIEEIGKCNLLYIPASESVRIDKIQSKIRGRSILTVTDAPGLFEKGVHFNIYSLNNETYLFEINQESITQSSLRVDVMLLNYAKNKRKK